MSISESTTFAVRYLVIEDDPDYRAGDDGSIWSHKSGEWVRLKPTPQSRGHLAIWLGRERQRFVHCIVLEAFIGPCPEGMECRHLDGNPANNRIGNLKWGTPAENHADSVRHGTAACLRPEWLERARTSHAWSFVEHKSGEKHHRAKLSDEQVKIIMATVDPAKRDGTATRLANEWNVTPAAVRMIARGLRRCSG